MKNKILKVLEITEDNIAQHAGVTRQAVSYNLRTGATGGRIPMAVDELIAAAKFDTGKIAAAQATRTALNEFLGE